MTETTNATAPVVAGKPATKKAATKATKTAKKTAKKTTKVAKKATPKNTTTANSNGNEAVRPGSNMEIIFKMISEAKGATIEEMAKKTGWEMEMTARTLSNIRRKGIGVTRNEEGRYTLTT